ncbi:hypothetical protein OAD49_04450 [Flavobacteriaceae bacterium]|nr:hypothetical protein [Flavobacteriaceae bacterium]
MKRFLIIMSSVCVLTACAQNNSKTETEKVNTEVDALEKSYSSDDNLSPEIKQLKAEFMSQIKQLYFIEQGRKGFDSVKIVLISDIRGAIYTYFTYNGPASERISYVLKKRTGAFYAPQVSKGRTIKDIVPLFRKPKYVVYKNY